MRRLRYRHSTRFHGSLPALSPAPIAESAPIRAALGRDELRPEDDARLTDFGIGLTDAVKRPSPTAADLRDEEFAAWAPVLRAKLARFAPRVACFHGLTAYRPLARHALKLDPRAARLGPQPAPPGSPLGATRLWVVPNPSGANAHFRLADQVAWYDHLADYLDALRAGRA